MIIAEVVKFHQELLKYLHKMGGEDGGCRVCKLIFGLL